ncbi:FAD/NAD-P-binding domain-containing protein [Neohortaea acidophila]|uniref:FAD/NAD-P-binding domain-containing protein n=1 Tax=Neohortaea acidophila TaxID=245834 RepID=A0A6A6PSM0_9PEZI|nr:FAD/NAD-P-binding domain-containing protein [Neohortaea acidophila]KAF2483098.1 FAD/NAD-P-binding domain-containing protein [Neohortaea acidophila]
MNGTSNDTKAPSATHIPFEDRPGLYGWKTRNDRGYEIRERPSGEPRRMRVIGVGAGASGINLAKALRDDAENIEVAIYDKNPEVGGTWWENRYPGVRCDIPSVVYQYTWNPKVWNEYYSGGAEILQYLKDTVESFQLTSMLHLRHLVTEARWYDDVGKWKVSVTNLEDGRQFEDECDVFVNAMGFLNNWRWPDISGLKDFKGTLAHSADFPEGLVLKDKRVAVVGNGSSGIQLVAALQPQVSHLFTWIRSPTWMTAGFAGKYAGPDGANFRYSEEQKRLLEKNPDYYLQYRKAVETEMVSGFARYHRNTPESKAAHDFASKDMKTRLASAPKLIDTLIPRTFPVGCKRPTPGNGYLEALVQDNVTVFTDSGLEKITEKGVLGPDGKEHELDAILLATGFDTSWVPRFPIIAHGTNLQDVYKERPVGYLGVAAPGMPNYFSVYGPYGPLASGSAMPMITAYVNYIVQMVKHIQREDVKSVTPQQQAIEQYAEHTALFTDRTVWNAPCRSWFKGNKVDGRILLHPGSRNQFLEMMARPRLQDYDFVYRTKNMWAWLGNGFSTRDFDGKDLTWYFGLVDGEDRQKQYDVHEMYYDGGSKTV